MCYTLQVLLNGSSGSGDLKLVHKDEFYHNLGGLVWSTWRKQHNLLWDQVMFTRWIAMKPHYVGSWKN